MPLGFRMHSQAQIYREHKEQLKDYYDQEKLVKEMDGASFTPQLSNNRKYFQE
jgi:hypothetical protein